MDKETIVSMLTFWSKNAEISLGRVFKSEEVFNTAIQLAAQNASKSTPVLDRPSAGVTETEKLPQVIEQDVPIEDFFDEEDLDL